MTSVNPVSPPSRTMQKFGVQTEKGKVIIAWKNADKYQEEGVRIVIHPTKFKTYDQLKVELNKKVGLYTGAVQKVYGMDKRMIKTLEEFEDGANYICCGAEKLDDVIIAKGLQGIFGVKGEQVGSSGAPASSNDTDHPTTHTTTTSTTSPTITSPPPMGVTSPTKRSVFEVGTEKAKVIWTFRNGDKTHAGERITVHASKFKTFDQLKDALSKQVALVTGAVRKIYTSDGTLIKSLDEFQDGANYICCGGEALDLNTTYRLHKQ